jgi:hypothetical protein
MWILQINTILLFQGSLSKVVHFFKVPAAFHWISTDEPHPKFPVQGHMLNIGGDALIPDWYVLPYQYTYPYYTPRLLPIYIPVQHWF